MDLDAQSAQDLVDQLRSAQNFIASCHEKAPQGSYLKSATRDVLNKIGAALKDVTRVQTELERIESLPEQTAIAIETAIR